MATKTEVVLVCDLCYSESEVSEHLVTLDRKKVAIELCPRCLGKTRTSLQKVLSKGRRPGAQRRQAPEKKRV